MPKEVIDYSNTIIYKIVCNDINITDTYVGHTTNFVQRKHAHKQGVNNPKCSNYNCKLYKFIRNHGGWTNWSMIIVTFKNCSNNYEACALEHEYYKLLNANLNSIDPCKPKEIIEKKEKIIDYKYICDQCDFKNNNKDLYNKHIKEHSKYKSSFENNDRYEYICKICHYKTCKKFNYEKHLETSKHKKLTATYEKVANKNKQFICKCGKVYKHNQSLYNHKKTCNFKQEDKEICQEIENQQDNININNQSNLENLVVQLLKENNEIKNTLLKENKELRQQISELIPKVGNNNSNNNNHFNINLFLNEKCKNAISMQEFVKNIEVSLKNLLTTKNKGITFGINEIINENMNKLSLYERPIHCTDKKRETLYIKNDKWEKDTDKASTASMLKGIQLQQIKNLHKFKEANPNYQEDDKLKHEYIILLNKCTKSLNEHEKKLFKNICDSTYIKDDEILINN
uniref:MIGE-like protein n=1 Tax=Nucleocytoviricota sp. TaxID=2809609 RepID=A0A9E8G4S4_9VIRU|nr:MIGE-like protein [Nucleocytoviricota sp.]UZT29066.1 MIGE-like protein [Nucleocytoviricota sp.]